MVLNGAYLRLLMYKNYLISIYLGEHRLRGWSQYKDLKDAPRQQTPHNPILKIDKVLFVHCARHLYFLKIAQDLQRHFLK